MLLQEPLVEPEVAEPLITLVAVVLVDHSIHMSLLVLALYTHLPKAVVLAAVASLLVLGVVLVERLEIQLV